MGSQGHPSHPWMQRLAALRVNCGRAVRNVEGSRAMRRQRACHPAARCVVGRRRNVPATPKWRVLRLPQTMAIYAMSTTSKDVYKVFWDPHNSQHRKKVF